MEQWCQSPLNLVKKSKPVAIVAPSSKISESKSEDDSDEKSESREEGEDGSRSKSSNSAKYYIDRLLEKDDNNDRATPMRCSNNFYSMLSDLSSTEQQVLAATYMRDLMINMQNPYLRFSNYGGYPSPFLGAYENYKRLMMAEESAEKDASPEEESQNTSKDDPYPFLRERLNARPVYAEKDRGESPKSGQRNDTEEEDENVEGERKPHYEKEVLCGAYKAQAKSDCGDSEEPLNLRVSSEEPLDFSKKSSSFLLHSGPVVPLTLNLKSPEYENLVKPLVLTIPNPQERTSKQKKERSSKSKR
ncbi:hypothetical protein RUM43_001048 [Polyplax serrata]|uniref:Uncharacterized protein n=1 Tax=Polyplax serrata TaxID=468196 RepID=A0AAN8SDC7_POLSC